MSYFKVKWPFREEHEPKVPDEVFAQKILDRVIIHNNWCERNGYGRPEPEDLQYYVDELNGKHKK